MSSSDSAPGQRHNGSHTFERLCGTCAHWTNVEADYAYPSVIFGQCKAVPHRSNLLDGGRPSGMDWDAWETEEERLLASTKATANDGSGYHAELRTQADFGCVLHITSPTVSESTERGESNGLNPKRHPL